MAAIKGSGVRVKGLDELRRELKAAQGKGGDGIVKDANIKVAQHVRGIAAGRMATASSRAASSMTASKSGVAARINAGGASAPWWGGLEFGAARDRSRALSNRRIVGWRQFQTWRGSGGGAGYYLYPTIREEIDTIVEMYGDELERALRPAFPD